MKLRLRLNKCSKVIEISNDSVKNVTVSDLSERVLTVFQDALFGEYYLSLNNRDALEGALTLVGDCDIVSGDLIYIVVTNSTTQASPYNQQNVGSAAPARHQHYGRLVGEAASSVQTNKESDEQLDAKSHTAHNNSLTGQLPGTSSAKTVETTHIQPGTSSVDTMETEHSGPGTSSMNTIETEHTEPGTSFVNIVESEQPGTSADVTMDTEDDLVDMDLVKECLSEPVLCREATNGCVPALLKEVFDSAGPQHCTECLSVVLHVLMLETGFTIHPEAESSSISQLPEDWRYGGYHKFSYTYPGCADISCCMTVIPTGDTTIVHGKILGRNDATRQCPLKPSEYVQAVNTDCAECYSQLARLSRLFKDSIANPLVHDIRTAAGLVDVFGLLALTQEIKLRVLSFLDVRSLLQVSLVNTEMLDISKDPYLWRCLHLRNFGNRRDNSLSQNWRQFFRQAYLNRRALRKMMSRMRMITPSYFGPQNPFSGPSNWVPPVPGGIIGGDYDLYPTFPSLPGVPGRMVPTPSSLPRPRYDLIGPGPDVDPGPDPGLIPRRPGASGRGGGRGGPFGSYGGFGPRFL